MIIISEYSHLGQSKFHLKQNRYLIYFTFSFILSLYRMLLSVHNLKCHYLCVDDRSSADSVVFSHYVVCNDTQCALRFGQAGTDENLVIQPREMHQYSWRTHKMKQVNITLKCNHIEQTLGFKKLFQISLPCHYLCINRTWL